MASVNKVILIGNLGRDPETRYMPNGDAVTNVTIATTESWKDKGSGERQEKTEWHRVTFYRRLAEVAGEYLKKGAQVYIEGRLANAQLRDAKMAAHSAFDHLWQHGPMKRADAYAWLADQMGIQRGRCHIGWMDVGDCGRVVELCRAELRRRASEQIEERA